MTNHPELLTVVATYRVREDRLADFMKLLADHHPALLAAGLVTESAPVVYRGVEERGVEDRGGPIVFEIFDWKTADAPGIAHELPEIARIWEAMGTMCEARGGKPQFDFPHVERVG